MNGQGKEIANVNLLEPQHFGEGNTTRSVCLHKPHIYRLEGKPTAIAPKPTRAVTLPVDWHTRICEERNLIFSQTGL